MTAYLDKVKKSAEIIGLRGEIKSLLWNVKRLIDDAAVDDFAKFKACRDAAYELLRKATECYEELP